MVTPRKPSVDRSSVLLIAGDQPAAACASYAVYVAFESITSGRLWPNAVRYGTRPGASAVRVARIVTMLASVLRVANPSPGKCFMAGISPADSRPVAKASLRRAVTVEENDQVRPCR